MTPAAFLVQLHDQYLAGRDGELVKGEHGTFVLISSYQSGIVVSSERKNNLLLDGCALHYLLIHNLERHEIHLERHIRLVAYLRVEIEQPVVGVNTAQEVLDAESLAADVLDMAFVLLMDALVDQLYELGGFTAQFLQVDVKRVVRTVHLAAVMDEILHLDVQ